MVVALSEEKIIDGEIHTRESIIERHEKLVHWQCHKFKHYARRLGQEYEDILSIGMFSLVKAFDRFDCQVRAKYSTYATHLIWGDIHNYLRTINTGLYYSLQIKEVANAISKKGLESEPIEEIVEVIGFNRSRVSYALKYLNENSIASLDRPINEEENTFLMDFTGFNEDFSSIYVHDFLHCLKPRERIVLAGLINEKAHGDIGAELGVTAHRVSRIKKRIQEKYLEFYGAEEKWGLNAIQ